MDPQKIPRSDPPHSLSTVRLIAINTSRRLFHENATKGNYYGYVLSMARSHTGTLLVLLRNDLHEGSSTGVTTIVQTFKPSNS